VDTVETYLKEIGRTPLLTREEEVAVARRLEYSRERYRYALLSAELRAELGRLMRVVLETPATARRRLARISIRRQHYQDARSELCRRNLRLVVSIAKKYRHRGVSFLDLIQEGSAGLMRAVDKFEYKRGYKFCTYATWWIRQAITRAIAEKSRTIYVPSHFVQKMGQVQSAYEWLALSHDARPNVEQTAEAADMSVEETGLAIQGRRQPLSLDQPIGDQGENPRADFLPDPHDDDPLEKVERDLLRSRIEEALEVLSWREREVIKLRYGLGDGHSYTLQEVGTIFRVSRERIRQIETRALERLQQSDASRSLWSFVGQSVSALPNVGNLPGTGNIDSPVQSA